MTENRTLIAIATYNEIENLPLLVESIREHVSNVDLLVVDDGSPDGTGQWCDERAATDQHFHCLHRAGKQGLGTATLAAMNYAIEQQYALLITMDADFSHHPRYVPDLLQVMRENPDVDVTIGSRYVTDGGIEGWPLHRRWMSWAINCFARTALRLSIRDCSGAFRCYRVECLEKIALKQLRSTGYSYLEEILWILARSGANFRESPIVFVDRIRGQTKINWQEAVAAIWLILSFSVSRPPAPPTVKQVADNPEKNSGSD